jgi:hypothetical protein
MRIDVLSRMSFKSGTLILIQIEDLKRLIDKKINKKIDEYEIICDVVENGGEMVSMDPYENVSIGKMYTLDEEDELA